MLKITNLTKSYGNRLILDRLSLVFPDRGFVAVTGENGCGKTTLLRILGLLDSQFSGSLELDGIDLSHAKESVLAKYRAAYYAYSFQEGNYLDGFSNKTNFTLWKKNNPKNSALLPHDGSGLSQGEKTLLSLSFVLSAPKKIILLDEVTASLSPENTQKLIGQVKEAAKTSLILFITHDASLYAAADYHLLLGRGSILHNDLPLQDSSMVSSTMVFQKKSFKDLLKPLLKGRFGFAVFSFMVFALFSGLSFSAFNLGYCDYRDSYLSYFEAGDRVQIVPAKDDFAWDLENHCVVPCHPGQISPNKEVSYALEETGLPFYSDIKQSSLYMYSGYFDGDFLLKVSSTTESNYKKQGKILNGAIRATIEKTMLLLPYQVDPSFDEHSRCLLNLNHLDRVIFDQPIFLAGSMWNNSRVNLATTQGKSLALGVLGENYFVSPSLVKETNLGPLSDDVLYLPESLKEYAVSTPSQFLTNQQISYGNYYRYYHDLSLFFPNGVKTIYSPTIAAHLSGREILVSDSVYRSMCDSFNFIGDQYLTLTSPKDDIEKIWDAGAEIDYQEKTIDGTDPKAKPISGISGLVFNRSFYQSLFNWFGSLHCFLIFLLTGILINLLKRKDKRNLLLLRSLGYTRFQAYVALASPLFVGLGLGIILGLVISWIFLFWVSEKGLFFSVPSLLLSIAVLCLDGLVLAVNYSKWQ